MRKAVLIAIVFAAFGLSGGNAQAQAKYWPWCVYYDGWSYNCGFATFQQCLATASGEGAFCRRNPYGPPAVEGGRRHKRAAHRD